MNQEGSLETQCVVLQNSVPCLSECRCMSYKLGGLQKYWTPAMPWALTDWKNVYCREPTLYLTYNIHMQNPILWPSPHFPSGRFRHTLTLIESIYRPHSVLSHNRHQAIGECALPIATPAWGAPLHSSTLSLVGEGRTHLFEELDLTWTGCVGHRHFFTGSCYSPRWLFTAHRWHYFLRKQAES